MDYANVEVDTSELQNWLDRLDNEQKPAFIKAVSDDFSDEAMREMSPLLPVDTGRLRSSVHERRTRGYLWVGTNVEYDIYVQMGLRGRARVSTAEGYRGYHYDIVTGRRVGQKLPAMARDRAFEFLGYYGG